MKLSALGLIILTVLSVSVVALENIQGGPTEFEKFGSTRSRRYGDSCHKSHGFGIVCKENVEFKTSRFILPFRVYDGVNVQDYKPGIDRVGKEELPSRIVQASTNLPAGYKPEEALRPATRSVLVIKGGGDGFNSWNRLRSVRSSCYFTEEGAQCPGFVSEPTRDQFVQDFKPGLVRIGKEELVI